jgi:outer membrane protein TolC
MRYIFSFFLVATVLLGSNLDELIEYGVKNSTIIKQSKIEQELSKLRKQESKAAQYGEVNVVGDVTHYNEPRTLAPLTPTSMASGLPITTTKDIFSLGLSYSVPLFTGYAQTIQIEMDEISKSLSIVKLKLTKEQLIYNIRSLYISILTQKEMLKAQKEYSNALLDLEQQIQNEVKFGKKADIDLLKAKADLQSSKTKEKILKSNIEILKASLSSLVGKSVKVVDGIDIQMKKPNFKIAKLYENIANLSKIKIDDMGIKKAEKVISKSKSFKYPQINLNSYVGRNYGNDIGVNGWDDETIVQVGLSIKYSIFDFGKRDIGVQKAEISKIEAKLKKEQTLLDLKRDILEAIQKIKQSYANYSGNKIELELTKKSEKIENVRYKNGVSTLNDLLLAKSKTEFALSKMIQNRYDYQKNIYYLDYVLEKGEK